MGNFIYKYVPTDINDLRRKILTILRANIRKGDILLFEVLGQRAKFSVVLLWTTLFVVVFNSKSDQKHMFQVYNKFN